MKKMMTILVILLALMMTACAGTPQTTTPAETTTAETTTAAAAEPVKVYELTEKNQEEPVMVEGETFDGDVVITGDNGMIVFTNCTFKGNVINKANVFTRVIIAGGSTVAGKCILQNDIKEATFEYSFPKFISDCTLDVQAEGCIGAAITDGNIPVTFNGKTYTSDDIQKFTVVDENGNASFVPYEDQTVASLVVVQWWENGEKILLVTAE